MAKSPTNFNIYEVLEPQKCSLITPKDENVGLLIDICDATDNVIDLSGSHLDSIKKSEFDLVDLYQNIYVTPQHVKKLNEEQTLKQKAQDKKDSYQNGLKPLGVADINELLGVSDKNVTDSPGNSNYMLNDNIFSKYAIPKVLKAPSFYDSDCEIKEPVSGIGNNVQEKSTKVTTDYHNYLFEKEVTDLMEKKRMESTLPQTNFANKEEPVTKSIDHKEILQKVARDLIARKSTESSLQNVNGAQDIGNSTFSLNRLPKVENFDTLQTAKLDKKLYAKQRLTKSEREKVLYTKGPNLYEKSVILPQIMKRLAVRKQELDEVTTRRLILDSGKRSECSCVHKTMNSKGTHESLKGSIASKEVFTVAAKNKLPTEVDSLKGNIASKEVFTVAARNKLPTEVDSPEMVKINPIVAMEDCNKERLLAHRVRSAFERFVHTGSYF